MPIKITDKTGLEIAWLCSESWELPVQLNNLEKWLETEGYKLPKERFIADVGFYPRQNAAGGSCSLSTKSMEIMLSIGMELFLSEYPEFTDEKQNTNEKP